MARMCVIDLIKQKNHHKNKKVPERPMTQEEKLKEAEETERINTESLKHIMRLEDDVREAQKMRMRRKYTFYGPYIVYSSKLTPPEASDHPLSPSSSSMKDITPDDPLDSSNPVPIHTFVCFSSPFQEKKKKSLMMMI